VIQNPADRLFVESLQAVGYQGDTEAVLQALWQMHGVPLRYYHTWEDHIRPGMEFLAKHRHAISNFHEVVVAWGFHDCICIAGAKGNEQASSEYSRKVLAAGGVPMETHRRMDALIMATTHSTDLTYEPLAAQAIADLDLMALAEVPFTFRENTTKLRKEASGIDDFTFGNGVRAFFQSLLKRHSIFYTLLFRNTFEAQAQENLKSWVVPSL